MTDLKSVQKGWQSVLLPTKNYMDMGTSAEIYSALNQVAKVSRTSPIVFMRSQKSEAERKGVRHANVRDAVAICESLRILEEIVRKIIFN